MPIKNYTSNVSVYASLGEIQGALAEAGAMKIMVDYDNGKPIGVTFALDTPMGIRTAEGAVYTEVSIRRSDIMNEAIKAGEVFRLAEIVPYQDGKIVNMDVVHNDKMKFVIMAFDAGTELSEHAAPGEALIFVLDGEGVIGYEGKEHPIKAGENFRFAKAGIHSVKAAKRFKMALLLTLES